MDAPVAANVPANAPTNAPANAPANAPPTEQEARRAKRAREKAVEDARRAEERAAKKAKREAERKAAADKKKTERTDKAIADAKKAELRRLGVPDDGRDRWAQHFQNEPMAIGPAEDVATEAWQWSRNTALLGSADLESSVGAPALLGPTLDQLLKGRIARAKAMTVSVGQPLDDTGRAIRPVDNCGFPANGPRPRTAIEVEKEFKERLENADAGYAFAASMQSACDEWTPVEWVRKSLKAAQDAERSAAAREAAAKAKGDATGAAQAAAWRRHHERAVHTLDHLVQNARKGLVKTELPRLAASVGLIEGLGNAHRMMGYGHDTAMSIFPDDKLSCFMSAKEGADFIEDVMRTHAKWLRIVCNDAPLKQHTLQHFWAWLSAAPPRALDDVSGQTFLDFDERERFKCYKAYHSGEHVLQLLPPVASGARALPQEVAARRQMLALLGSPVLAYVAATVLVWPSPPTLSDEMKHTAALLGILSTLGGGRARAHLQRLCECWVVDKSGKVSCKNARADKKAFYVLNVKASSLSAMAGATVCAKASALSALAGTDAATLEAHSIPPDGAKPPPYAAEGCTAHLVPVLVRTAVGLYRNLVRDALGAAMDDRALATVLWTRAKHVANNQPHRVWKDTEDRLAAALANEPELPAETLAQANAALERFDQVVSQLAASVRCSDALVDTLDAHAPSWKLLRSIDAVSDKDDLCAKVLDKQTVRQQLLQLWADVRTCFSQPTGPAKDPMISDDCSEASLVDAIKEKVDEYNFPAKHSQAACKESCEPRAAIADVPAFVQSLGVRCRAMVRGDDEGGLRAALASVVAAHPDALF